MSKADELFAAAPDHTEDAASATHPMIQQLQDHISKTQALGHGFVQGGTLGAAPQIGAAMQAGLLAIDPDEAKAQAAMDAAGIQPKDAQGNPIGGLLDTYRKARDQNKEEEANIKAAHPYMYGAGELAGGAVASTAAAPLLGSSALAAAGKAPGLMAAGARVGNAALSGAQIGAASGLVGGNADLTKGDISGTVSDMAQGAKTGGLVGGAFGAAINTPSIIGGIASKLNKTGARAFQLGEQGEPIFTPTGKTNINLRNDKIIQNISNDIQNDIHDTINARTSAAEGKSISGDEVSDIIDRNIDTALKNSDITDPTQAEQIRTSLKKSLYDTLPQKIQKIVKTSGDTTTETIKGPGSLGEVPEESELPEMQPSGASKRVSTKQGGEESELGQGDEETPPSVSSTEKFSGEIPGQIKEQIPINELLKRVTTLRGQAGKMGTGPGEAAIKQGVAQDLSAAAKEAAPETAPLTAKLGQYQQMAENQIGEPSYEHYTSKPVPQTGTGIYRASPELTKTVQGFNNPENATSNQNLMELLSKVKGPEYAQQFAKQAQQVATDAQLAKSTTGNPLEVLAGGIKKSPAIAMNVAGLSSNLAKAPAVHTAAIASGLAASTNPTAKRLSDILNQMNASPEKKPALLFSTSQDADYRDLLNPLLGEKQ